MQEQVARLVYRLILKCVVRTRNFTSQCKNCFKQTNEENRENRALYGVLKTNVMEFHTFLIYLWYLGSKNLKLMWTTKMTNL